MYFEEFAQLLERVSSRDPVQELLEYRAARNALRRRETSNEARAQVFDALNSHALPVPTSADQWDEEALLRSLEDNVPIAFGSVVDNDELVTLLQSLVASSDWRHLRMALVDGTLLQASAPTRTDQRQLSEDVSTSLEGLVVLWVDDNPKLIENDVELVRNRGAMVSIVTDTDAAEAELTGRRFDVLISDIGRGEVAEAGLDGLEHLVDLQLAPEARIFYVARITAARRRRARALSAEMTSTQEHLLIFLEEVAEAVRAE